MNETADQAALRAFAEIIAGALEKVATAIERVSYGGMSGPTGLEALGMMIAGERHGGIGEDSLASQLSAAIENGFESLGDRLTERLKP